MKNLEEAIILAGGFGTRLQSAVPDLQKCMAPVAGRPFLAYIIDSLIEKGVTKIIFSLGYKYEYIVDFVEKNYPLISKHYSIETSPLGTGGALKKSLSLATSENIFVFNGDTYFDVDIQSLFQYHLSNNSICTLALKEMIDFDRYGTVETDDSFRIINFTEKKYYSKGLINGGVYCISVSDYLKQPTPEKFSFEKDYMEIKCKDNSFYGYQDNGFFIDIGIPSDYHSIHQNALFFKSTN